MIVAALAGIRVFATGGIGGVHKGAEKSFDISADLDELARTPVIVVSAGAKAILDIEKTLEVLETRGVPVVAYRSDMMPAFWSRTSRSRRRSGSTRRPTSRASTGQRRALGLDGRAAGRQSGRGERRDRLGTMAVHIAAAQAARRERRHLRQGRDAVPAGEDPGADGGASLKTNIALVENNARLAARIAREL